MVSVSDAFFKKEGIKFINGFDPLCFPHSNDDINFKDCFGHMIEPYRSESTEHFIECLDKRNLNN